MMDALKRLMHSTKAATALEFAFVGPLAILILIVGMNLSFGMFLKSMLNDALIEAARWGATGQNSLKNGTRFADINYVIQTKTALSPTVTAQNYSSIASVPADLTSVCNTGGSTDSSLGNAGDVVVYCLSYADPIISATMRGFLPNFAKSSLTIVVTTMTKNEPF